MPQQAAIAVHAYDSDANLDGRTDDEQEHQEPPQSKAQSRVSFDVLDVGQAPSASLGLMQDVLVLNKCKLP